jgi:hypothetical protein
MSGTLEPGLGATARAIGLVELRSRSADGAIEELLPSLSIAPVAACDTRDRSGGLQFRRGRGLRDHVRPDAQLSSRPSNPAPSRGCGLSHRSGSTVHDHHTPIAILQHRSRPTLLSHRHRPRVADSDRQRRLRREKPGASNTRSLGRSHPGRQYKAYSSTR